METVGNHLCVQKFYRLKVKSVMYHCEEYYQVQRRNSFTVKFVKFNEDIGFGSVKYYL